MVINIVIIIILLVCWKDFFTRRQSARESKYFNRLWVYCFKRVVGGSGQSAGWLSCWRYWQL